jgi:modulator of FtsH protease
MLPDPFTPPDAPEPELDPDNTAPDAPLPDAPEDVHDLATPEGDNERPPSEPLTGGVPTLSAHAETGPTPTNPSIPLPTDPLTYSHRTRPSRRSIVQEGNMYPNSNYSSNPIVIEGRATSTISLLSKVLLITSLGFFVSAVGVWLAPAFYAPALMWVYFFVSLGLILAVNATRKNPALSLVLFLALALVMGFEIAPWISYLMHSAGGIDIVFNAALTTAVGMAVIGLGAQVASFDYRKVGNYAIGALFVLIIIGVLGMFFHFVSPTLYSWATLAIFSVLLLVDFMRIRNGGDGLTAVQLALSIYLDGLNIFLALTRIFSGGRRS